MMKTNTNTREQDHAETRTVKLSASARWALASLSLSMLMPSLDTSIANAALPTLMEAFGASFQQVQWIVLAYLLAITTLIVSAGRLGDIVGRRRLLLAGIGLFTAASLLCGVAPSLTLLIAGRALQGLGAAIMMALTVALAGEAVPKERTGSAMGLLGTMSAIGTTLGPSLGGILMNASGWRMIFLVNVPLGTLNFLVASRFLTRDEPQNVRSAFDPLGTLLLCLTLAAYALALTLGRGSFGAINIALLTTAVFGTLLFLVSQGRSASPLINLALLRDPLLATGLAMSALVSTVMMATLVVGPFYLSQGLGLETAIVGLALSAGPLVAAIAGIPAGRIVDRFGPPRMTIFGLAGIVTGTSALSIVPESFGPVGYVVPIIITTASYALFQAANNTAIMTGIDVKRRGTISGILSLSRNLGLITGASAMGAVFAAASGTAELTDAVPEAISSAMRTTFAVAAFLIMAAITIALGSRARSRRVLTTDLEPCVRG